MPWTLTAFPFNNETLLCIITDNVLCSWLPSFFLSFLLLSSHISNSCLRKPSIKETVITNDVVQKCRPHIWTSNDHIQQWLNKNLRCTATQKSLPPPSPCLCNVSLQLLWRISSLGPCQYWTADLGGQHDQPRPATFSCEIGKNDPLAFARNL